MIEIQVMPTISFPQEENAEVKNLEENKIEEKIDDENNFEEKSA